MHRCGEKQGAFGPADVHHTMTPTMIVPVAAGEGKAASLACDLCVVGFV